MGVLESEWGCGMSYAWCPLPLPWKGSGREGWDEEGGTLNASRRELAWLAAGVSYADPLA